MQKDFDRWNEHKKAINDSNKKSFCHPREIWWCSIGVNVGFEQDGTGKNHDRPVVVVKGFNEDMFFGVPLTGSRREGKYYFPLGLVDGREASAILSQARPIDSKRLIRKIGTIDKKLFEQLRSTLNQVLLS
jgi:mRNA interferase MazF